MPNENEHFKVRAFFLNGNQGNSFVWDFKEKSVKNIF